MLCFPTFSPLPIFTFFLVCLVEVVVGWSPVGLWGTSLLKSGAHHYHTLQPTCQGSPLQFTRPPPFQRQDQTCLFALPKDHKLIGEDLIRQAAESCGITDVDQALSIEWQPGRIVVTVQTPAYISSSEEGEVLLTDQESEEMELLEADDNLSDEEQEEISDDEAFDESALESDELLSDDDTDTESLEEQAKVNEVDGPSLSLVEQETNIPQTAVDIAKLSSAISILLGNTAIAEHYEVEVTTPRRKELVLEGRLLEIYKGFEVVCRYINPKTKKEDQLTGRLVEQNKRETVLRVQQGRKKKVPNEDVICIALAEAKYEKGDLYR